MNNHQKTIKTSGSDASFVGKELSRNRAISRVFLGRNYSELLHIRSLGVSKGGPCVLKILHIR